MKHYRTIEPNQRDREVAELARNSRTRSERDQIIAGYRQECSRALVVPNKPSRMATSGKWLCFCWAYPLFGREGGPYYYGIYWRRFQLGYWESPDAYRRRVEVPGDARP